MNTEPDLEEIRRIFRRPIEPLPTIERKHGIIGFRRDSANLSQSFPDNPIAEE